MTELAAKTLELARAAIGVTEHPPGSNRGPEVDRYLRNVGIDPEQGGAPWCAAYVTTMVMDAANALGSGRVLHGNASVHRLLTLNAAALTLSAPEPGCVFIHLNPDGTGHCGFVEALALGGALETIEGNSDAHGSRTGGSVVAGFRRADYAQHFLAIA